MNETTALRQDVQRNDRTLRKQIQTLTNALTAAIAAINAKTQRANTTTSFGAPGTQDLTITWPTEWPDTAYWVGIELLTGTAAIGAAHATLKAGSKTTTDCIITVTATTVLATIGVDIVGVRT